jgi:hypothetical protein
MKKTSAVAKATPKKVATKKVAQKKEKRSVGKIEINYINHGKSADATMKVYGMTKKEVLGILTDLGIKLAEEMMNEHNLSERIKKSIKKVATKKTTTKKTK